jgi:uncharacterized protein (DUF2336 family)
VVKLPTLPNLDGLIGLARQDGVDVRPTLVRVLTDLYVHKRTHTSEEEHRFTELALWLLAAVDVPTRAAVAKKLASYAQAPRLVVRRLARDVFEVAEPILKLSQCLTSDDLLAIIRDFGPRYAGAISERDGEQAQTGEAAQPAQANVDAAPAPSVISAAAALPEPRAGQSINDGPAPLAGMRPRSSVGDQFLSAGKPERRLLLANLQDGTLTSAEQVFAAATEEALSALEAAALDRRPEDFVRDLERFLRIPAATAQQIVADDAGEPLVVAARALGMRSDVFLRVLLFLNPAIGHSVERVFGLVDLYDEVSTEAALHIVSSWQTAVAAEKRTARYQPLHFDDETRKARRTFGEHARRFPLQVPDERRSVPSDEVPVRAQRTT